MGARPGYAAPSMFDPRSEPTGGPTDLFTISQIRHLMRVEFSRAQRYGYPLACLVVRIDGLTALRDRAGYDAKEAAVDGVARLLAEQTRVCDYLGRLAHDRLTAVLPHTSDWGARVVAERVLEKARTLEFPDLADLPGGAPRISVSIGAAHYYADNTLFFDAVLDEAEAACERASSEGGDRLAEALLGGAPPTPPGGADA